MYKSSCLGHARSLGSTRSSSQVTLVCRKLCTSCDLSAYPARRATSCPCKAADATESLRHTLRPHKRASDLHLALHGLRRCFVGFQTRSGKERFAKVLHGTLERALSQKSQDDAWKKVLEGSGDDSSLEFIACAPRMPFRALHLQNSS